MSVFSVPPPDRSREYSFQTEQRIRQRAEFQRFFDQGDFFKGEQLNIWCLKNPETARPKLGMMVSKKTHPRATRRNLWKRRIREAFRQRQTGMCRGMELLVQSRGRGAAVPPYDAIARDLERLLLKAGVWKR